MPGRLDLQELAEACLSAARDPRAQVEQLQALLQTCGDRLKNLAGGEATASAKARAQVAAIADLIEEQGAVWPEDVARMEALAAEVRERADRL